MSQVQQVQLIRCVSCREKLPLWVFVSPQAAVCARCVQDLREQGVTFFSPDGTEYQAAWRGM